MRTEFTCHTDEVCLLLKQSLMEATGKDIVFACAHCGTSYVVDAAAAGVTLECQNCCKQTTVPSSHAGAAAPDARISEVQHQLKENGSQRTEITGYINQLSIQLHRWQLRLKDLNEREQKLTAELAALRSGQTS
ncbi:MAG TPA: hypothetical protein VGC85_10695 [Chthoniobacterales bacterium]